MADYQMNGPGYSIRVPEEFELMMHDPQMGRAIFKLPPDFIRSIDIMEQELRGLLSSGRMNGADDTGALVSVHPLSPTQVPDAIHEQPPQPPPHPPPHELPHELPPLHDVPHELDVTDVVAASAAV